MNQLPRQQPGSSDDPFDLDTPLLYFSRDDAWTIRDACEGVHIFGSIGSGKTSGSGATIAKSFLRAKMGGLVLCAKPEERRLWERYAAETDRSGDLVIIEPGSPWHLNFMGYEAQRAGRGGGLTENILNLLTRIMEIVEAKQEVAGGDSFWERAMKELVRNAVDLLAVAKGNVTLEDIMRLVADAPLSRSQVEDETWQASSFCFEMMQAAEMKANSDRQKHDVNIAITYYGKTFPAMGDRTRASIVATFSSIGDILLHGDAWELFCTDTTIVPEVTYRDGAIILLDYPIQEFHELGRLVQGLFKFLFQRAILRRDVSVDPRPVFLFVDEAQNFVSSYDFLYQAVARSARACTAYISQSVSNYFSVLGENAHDEAQALLGNFVTQIFHSNSNFPTNEYAANLIGQDWMTVYNFGGSQNSEGRSVSGGGSQAINYRVLPSVMNSLMKGGKPNNFEVEGIVYQSGRKWNASAGDTFLRAIFKQE